MKSQSVPGSVIRLRSRMNTGLIASWRRYMRLSLPSSRHCVYLSLHSCGGGDGWSACTSVAFFKTWHADEALNVEAHGCTITECIEKYTHQIYRYNTYSPKYYLGYWRWRTCQLTDSNNTICGHGTCNIRCAKTQYGFWKRPLRSLHITMKNTF